MNKSKQIPVFDGHNDTLLRYFLTDRKDEAFFQSSSTGHLDYPRARAGGFAGGMFAVFIPDHTSLINGKFPENPAGRPSPIISTQPIGQSYAAQMTDKAVACLKRMVSISDGRLKIVTQVSDIRHCIENNTIAAVLHFEGAEAIDEDLDNLPRYYVQGLRSLGLVWNRDNIFGRGLKFRFPGSPDQGPGLTDLGKYLVRACNELGIVVDLSHMNERGFRDVARISTAPLVATHSCVHALCPSSRNLTDRQLDAIGESGGIVGINFCVTYLRKDGMRNLDTPIDTVVDHIRYVADRIGVDHVAFGSDFDGAPIPNSIRDAAGIPALIGALRKSGFTEDELQKIANGNWLRVLNRTWKTDVVSNTHDRSSGR